MLRLSAVSIACVALVHVGCSGDSDKQQLVKGAYPRGMRNMGNTCFANAYWQVLAHNTHFKAYVESLPVPEEVSAHIRVVNATKNFVTLHVGGTMKPVVPAEFFGAYSEFTDLFSSGRQQDAMQAFERSNEILAESAAAVGGSNYDLFRFDLRTRFQCPNPQNDRFLTVPAGDLRLDLPASNQPQQLTILLDAYFAVSYNRDHQCDQPRHLHAGSARSHSVDVPAPRGGWQNFQMGSAPQLLAIQLKRFHTHFDRERGELRVDLIRTKVEFGENLRLVEAVHGVAAEYRLVGVVRHLGVSVRSGHYVSDYWHPELASWVHADDSQTFLVTGPNLSSGSAYILFYQRHT